MTSIRKVPRRGARKAPAVTPKVLSVDAPRQSPPAAPVPPPEPAQPRLVFCFDCEKPVRVDDEKHAALNHVTSPVRAERSDGEGYLSVPLEDVAAQEAARLSTGMKGVDRVLGGGGFAEDSIVLVEGDPGIGKSTLLAMIAGLIAARGGRVLYVSGEEAAGQIGGRARRVRVKPAGVRVLITGSLEDVLREIRLLDDGGIGPDLVIADSAQALRSDRVPGRAGSVGQVSFVADQLRAVAKTTHRIVVLVGQINKEGDMAGPKTMEHAVDARLKFGRDGSDGSDKRFILTIKNRYGAANELVNFKMGPHGLVEVVDPLLTMLEDTIGEPGVVPFVAAHLALSYVIPVEASVLSPNGENSTRSVSAEGFPMERLRFLLDMIGRHCDLALSRDTVRVRVPKLADENITDNALDLAVAAAIVSAKKNIPVRSAVVGEVGLSGKVLPAVNMDARLEASREHPTLEKSMVVPKRTPQTAGIHRVTIEHMSELPAALEALAAVYRARAPSTPSVNKLKTAVSTSVATLGETPAEDAAAP